MPAATSAQNLSRYIFSLTQYQAALLVIQQGCNDVYPRILPHMSRDYRQFARTGDERAAPTHNIGFIRRLVLWRKGSVGTHSATGSRFAERMLTVATTLRQQGRNVVDYVTQASVAAVHAHPAPSLLPVIA